VTARAITAPDIRIGISGWRYRGWRGVFYPEGLVQRRELEYAGAHFDSVEINGTFYGLQRPERFERWRDATPEGFVFAIKGSRYLTHMIKLRDPEIPLANFFASGPLALGSRMGPVLWQLPPQAPFDPARFAAFLDLLPRTTKEAARLAKKHDERLAGIAWTRTDADRPIRHAIEPRHASYFTPAFVRLLRKHRVALVFADTAQVFPYAEDLTADFVYLRLHGKGEIYAGGYDDAALDEWAVRLRAWTCGAEPADAKRILGRPAPRARRRDAYVYFDNDAKVRAPFDALALRRRLGLVPGCHDVRVAPAAPRLTAEEIEARRVESSARWKRG
jgi:uncharacterized protein YecE (DUF72 family)